MKRKFFLALLSIFIFAFVFVFSKSPASPIAGKNSLIPMDIDGANNVIQSVTTVKEYRNYFFYLYVCYKGQPDLYRISKLVGGLGRTVDGRYSRPGVVVPIHLTVQSLAGDTMYDRTVAVQGYAEHVFQSSDDGCFAREIASVALRPGSYRIKVSTVKETPDFHGVSSAISVEWRYNTRPIQEQK